MGGWFDLNERTLTIYAQQKNLFFMSLFVILLDKVCLLGEVRGAHQIVKNSRIVYVFKWLVKSKMGWKKKHGKTIDRMRRKKYKFWLLAIGNIDVDVSCASPRLNPRFPNSKPSVVSLLWSLESFSFSELSIVIKYNISVLNGNIFSSAFDRSKWVKTEGIRQSQRG